MALAAAIHAAEAPAKFLSHPPLRPLPTASSRPLPAGLVRCVDARKGDDSADGSEKQPWKTIGHALGRLKAGETLCLRGGVFHEQVTVALSGSQEKPITIRSYPGEVAIIDGGIPEFLEKPEEAWEPVAGGAPGEFRSKRFHPNLRDVLGAFGDSLIGLHVYHNAVDLRTDNEWWDLQNPDDPKNSDVKPVYCGPGLWYDRAEGRIHIRLTHTHVPGIENYAGESDPRKLPLVLAPFRSAPLHADGAGHIRFQDLVIRGGGYDTVLLDQSHDLEFENVTIFGSTYGVRATGMQRLKLDHCGMVGSVPPWCFRADTRLRSYGGQIRRDITRFGTHALLVQEAGREYSVFAYPLNDDWEIAHCDFTGSHDGLYLGGINVKFHHNRLWGTQDDGIYLSPMYARIGKSKAELHIYQNVFGNCLTALAFGGSELQNSDTVYLYRNVFDLRNPVKTGRPSSRDPKPRFSAGGVIGDHGSLPYSSMFFYHNTFVMADHARGADMGLFNATSAERPRCSFNNILLHFDRLPPLPAIDAQHDARAEGNLYWQPGPGLTPEAAAALLKPRRVPATAKVETLFLTGDPHFARALADPSAQNDYRLQAGSAAVDAGVELPADLPDPLRRQDKGKPDIGALPLGAEPLQAGR